MTAGAGAGLEVAGGIKSSSEVVVGMLCLFFVSFYGTTASVVLLRLKMTPREEFHVGLSLVR